MEKVLVTGGAGFIGGYLVNELLRMKKEVVIVDNLQSKKGGLGYIHPEAKFINHDITDPFLYQILDNHRFEGVYHLAAQTCGEDSYDNPLEDIKTNSYGTWLVANYCRTHNIPRLVYTSTSAVYGSACKDVVDEETPIEPESIYGVSKHAGELFIKQLLKDSDTNFTIFRLTNNYGPGENLNYQKKGLVSILCSFVWKNEPMKLKGDQNRFRDFLFVEDTVEALTKAYDCEKTFNNLYVLSTGEKIYEKELISKILLHSNHDEHYPMISLPGTPGDTHGFHADISKIKRDLGWEPKHSLDQGLQKYFEWISKVPVVDDISKYHPFLIK